MQIIRWGILGAAKFAREHMGPAIHAADGAALAALATSSDDKAAAFESRFPGIRRHHEYDALLADPEIDVIYIPLPNSMHVEWTIRALEAGKAVLCEKPVAMETADFDRLIAARDAAGTLAAEAYMVVQHPQWIRAKDLIADGAIGRLEQVTAAFSFNNPDPANIRNQAAAGGGALRDIGVYPLGTTRFVTDAEPVAAEAKITWTDGYDTTSRSRLDFPGFQMNMLVSTRLAPFQEMLFHGEDGLIRLAFPFNANTAGEARVELIRGNETRVERWPGVNQYVLQVEAFGNSLRSGVPYPCPLEFSRGTQAAMDMIFAADPAP
ncbi:Gfo/Idh/MocA family protein [Tropicimonas sp. IMCC6043]|uniref:Gfo/Idh/MocA family protein n=1 Tax=Tropicimonas sp. IMCC6043 TaxID=2510645 RepID=UPI00101C3310|nr:Gfo/Idh/MocA family oxidoreductase [Tropicimonas sp. IMCC6043]RYH08437.1 Gfo/Idh/MocA family oxidoreductase [Tropicimonas sp. IMCC6043]